MIEPKKMSRETRSVLLREFKYFKRRLITIPVCFCWILAICYFSIESVQYNWQFSEFTLLETIGFYFTAISQEEGRYWFYFLFSWALAWFLWTEVRSIPSWYRVAMSPNAFPDLSDGQVEDLFSKLNKELHIERDRVDKIDRSIYSKMKEIIRSSEGFQHRGINFDFKDSYLVFKERHISSCESTLSSSRKELEKQGMTNQQVLNLLELDGQRITLRRKYLAYCEQHGLAFKEWQRRHKLRTG